jgi:hypothetical protein
VEKHICYLRSLENAFITFICVCIRDHGYVSGLPSIFPLAGTNMEIDYHSSSDLIILETDLGFPSWPKAGSLQRINYFN